MNNQTNVSIIMPVYNSGPYLKTAVESILNQSFQNLELILVDDGSTDGSSKTCDEYAIKDSRVIVIHQKNSGICKARNEALKIAKGEYIAFSDHDDEYLPGYLEDAYNKAKEYDADLVKVGKVEYIIANNRVVKKKYSKLPSKLYSNTDIKLNYFNLVDSNELDCLWDGLFKKQLIDKYNIRLDEKYKTGGEDIDFIQRLLPYMNRLYTIDKIYYNHYIRKGFSTSAKYNPNKIEAKNNLMETMLITISKLGINIEKYQFEYTYHLLRQYIAPICALYSNTNCELTTEDICKYIQEIRNKNFYKDFCDKQSIIKIFSKSIKYGLLYLLFRYKMYKAILIIYQKRNS